MRLISRWTVGTAIGAAILLAFQAPNLLRYSSVVARPVVTAGTMTAVDKADHAKVRYSYTVEGASYSGVGNAGRGTPDIGDLTVGDSVHITYAADRPSVSFLGDPRRWLGQEVAIAIVGGLALTALSFLVVRLRATRAA